MVTPHPSWRIGYPSARMGARSATPPRILPLQAGMAARQVSPDVSRILREESGRALYAFSCSLVPFAIILITGIDDFAQPRSRVEMWDAVFPGKEQDMPL